MSGLLGPEGAQRRLQELLGRIQGFAPAAPERAPAETGGAAPQAFAGVLQGAIGGRPGHAPLDPAALGLQPAATSSSAMPGGDLRAAARRAAVEAGIDPGLFLSLVDAESSWNSESVSNKGAQGLTQLMPRTAAELGVTDPFDPEQNLRAGARYLAENLRRFKGDERLALAAYNAGPTRVERGGMPNDPGVVAYVNKILAGRGRAVEGSRP